MSLDKDCGSRCPSRPLSRRRRGFWDINGNCGSPVGRRPAGSRSIPTGRWNVVRARFGRRRHRRLLPPPVAPPSVTSTLRDVIVPGGGGGRGAREGEWERNCWTSEDADESRRLPAVDLRTGRTVSRVADYRAIRSLPVSAAARARDPSNRNSRRQGVEPVVTNTSVRQDTGRDFRFRQWSVRSASLFKSRRDCVQINARRVRTSRENVLVATITIVL